MATESAPLGASATAASTPPADPVLLIDDEEPSRVLAATMLRRAGYAVHEVASASEAMALLSDPANAFSLVATDIVMPGMSGAQLITKVRNLRRGLPMLAISGWSDLSFGDLTPAELGVDEDITFLSKPYSSKQLVAAVESVLHPKPRPGQPPAYYGSGHSSSYDGTNDLSFDD